MMTSWHFLFILLFILSAFSDLGTVQKISFYYGRIFSSSLEQIPQNCVAAAETVGIEI